MNPFIYDKGGEETVPLETASKSKPTASALRDLSWIYASKQRSLQSVSRADARWMDGCDGGGGCGHRPQISTIVSIYAMSCLAFVYTRLIPRVPEVAPAFSLALSSCDSHAPGSVLRPARPPNCRVLQNVFHDWLHPITCTTSSPMIRSPPRG